MDTKPLIKSKTFWLNGLTVLAGVLTYLVDQSIFTNPDVVAAIVVAQGIANVILRTVTKSGVSIK